ncbi:hypothetical protein FE781_16180 [Paenibacillus thermoaerophilus]|uniref:hypothetical protein n=1 Tax=Paenibacillus thermoaerophilus TaxID=1215385 RepID=UPI00110F4294|nr:hypothetical protein [Paenibacillus thermoaerophilus]TMV06744.1 hypothetical protein FE781_16180 [Paenibacillus thermoaerophilus]
MGAEAWSFLERHSLLEAKGKDAEVIEEMHIGYVLANMHRQRGTAGEEPPFFVEAIEKREFLSF